MNNQPVYFVWPARVLHWLMAVLILSMLFIGVGMVATVSTAHTALVNLHKPVGIAILLLAILRLAVRLRNPPPPLPQDLPPIQRLGALASHGLLYGLMLALPIVGWAMLSAGGYPIMLAENLRLPAIMQADGAAFATLRLAHRWLAYLLFVTLLAHIAAALYHGFIRRDGVLRSMLR